MRLRDSRAQNAGRSGRQPAPRRGIGVYLDKEAFNAL